WCSGWDSNPENKASTIGYNDPAPQIAPQIMDKLISITKLFDGLKNENHTKIKNKKIRSLRNEEAYFCRSRSLRNEEATKAAESEEGEFYED
ncbi:hypothetical protein P4E94_19340, partial [Pontiellaceae bacterium B12219]|nr:hypothetical protein [Pontiellaceae bacterium B12219]